MTEFIEYIMKKFLKDEYEERRKIHEDEVHVSFGQKTNQFVNKQLIIVYLLFLQVQAGGQLAMKTNQIPVFVCTLSFPNISCPLHVFEPRYRLMIRRCMEGGTREFGMCAGTNGPDP